MKIKMELEILVDDLGNDVAKLLTDIEHKLGELPFHYFNWEVSHRPDTGNYPEWGEHGED